MLLQLLAVAGAALSTPKEDAVEPLQDVETSPQPLHCGAHFP
jgi:hypothetical protein